MTKILAIDPGMHSTACLYMPGTSRGWRWHFFDVPIIEHQHRPDVRPLRDFIREHQPDHVFIELVGPMPRQGISSTSKFMRATGHIEGTIDCLDIPMTRVTPQRWKKFHAIGAGADKDVSRTLAIQLAPELAMLLLRKKDHNRAEAALLALYGAYCLAPIEDVA